MSAPSLPLGDLFRIEYGAALKADARDASGEWDVFGSAGAVGRHSAALVKEPMIVVGRKGSVGKLTLAECGGWPIDTTFFMVPRKSNDISLRYAFHMLSRISLNHLTITTSIPGLNRNDLATVKIPVPRLNEQRRIAAILDKADAIRRKRQQALALADGFLRSAFLEMFGNCFNNPKNWPCKPLGMISEKFSDGPFGSNLKSAHYTHSGVRVLRLQNIGVNEFLEDDCVYISECHFSTLSKHTCVPGDLIIGTLGEPNLRAFIQPNKLPLALNKADCVQFRPDLTQCTAEYVCAMLNEPSTLAAASHLLHGQTRVRISMGTLRQLELPVPPLKQQKAFSGIFHKQQKQKERLRQALAEETALFASLSQRAFRGDL